MEQLILIAGVAFFSVYSISTFFIPVEDHTIIDTRNKENLFFDDFEDY